MRAALVMILLFLPVISPNAGAASVEQFSPTVEDDYYPAEESGQRAALVMPRVSAIQPERVLLADADGGSTCLTVGQSAQGWNLVAIATANGKPAAVFERHFDRWGLLAYADPSGEVATIRKAIGHLPAIIGRAVTYPADYEQTILNSRRDLLGERVLAQESDPSFESCAAFLPDVSGYTFLATEDSPQVVTVTADGELGSLSVDWGRKGLEDVLFDPAQYVPTTTPTDAKRGLVGGFLPAIDYGFYDRDARRGWEQMALASLDSTPTKLDLYIYLRIAGDEGTERREYFHVGHETELVSAAVFFDQLLQLRQHWDRMLAPAMQIALPEQRIVDASRASLARAFITYDGSTPRYGLGHYAAQRHSTFPPTTISTVSASIEWGLLDRARRYLDYYCDHVVRDDGTFDYYGPAVSEYGQLLDVIAQYVRRSGQTQWLIKRMPKIESVIKRLRSLRRESQEKFPKTDVRHGMIMGSPEADTRKEVNYYYSGNVWTWRGWTEIGRLLCESQDPALVQRGKKLLAECTQYAADIDASILTSVQHVERPAFVPPVAGFDEPFETMTQDRFASYTNYRYWIEMLSSGYLRPQWHDSIIEYRVAHGGELLGTTRFEQRLDDWPYAGYAYGLLHADRVRHFLLGFYGDLAMHRMRGTFTAYEQVAIQGLAERSYVADYCVPAQLVTPLAAKWMLVFEERDVDILWLCRATPRRWLGPDGGITVRRAPTRWGSIDFAITPSQDGTIHADIQLPRQNFPAEIRLRLRTPDAKPIQTVILNGQPLEDYDTEGEYIRIAQPSEAKLGLEVQYGPKQD